MVDVRGRWTLITGASRGVGRETALFMARQGANLILHSRTAEHTRAVAEAARAEGVEAVSVGADLADREAVQQLLNQVDELGHPVDIVFNNAGVQIAYRTNFWETPIDDFDKSFRINATAPALICLRLIPSMLARGFGRVINTTSGIRNEPEQSAYAASKAALDKFTKDLASRLQGTNVLINITDPGWCRTDLGGPQAPNAVETVVPGIAVGAFVDDGQSGRFLHAQAFAGMSLAAAVDKAATMAPTPYAI